MQISRSYSDESRCDDFMVVTTQVVKHSSLSWSRECVTMSIYNGSRKSPVQTHVHAILLKKSHIQPTHLFIPRHIVFDVDQLWPMASTRSYQSTRRPERKIGIVGGIGDTKRPNILRPPAFCTPTHRSATVRLPHLSGPLAPILAQAISVQTGCDAVQSSSLELDLVRLPFFRPIGHSFPGPRPDCCWSASRASRPVPISVQRNYRQFFCLI